MHNATYCSVAARVCYRFNRESRFRVIILGSRWQRGRETRGMKRRQNGGREREREEEGET